MPKTKWDGYQRFCPFARSLDVVGERWTLVILHALLSRPKRYSDLKTGHPGIGSNVLADRLRKLQQAGLVHRTPGGVGEGVTYELTERGQALGPAMAELRRWGVDELLGDDKTDSQYDLSYEIPQELDLQEQYEWRVDEQLISLSIAGQTLTQKPGPAAKPAIVVETSKAFMQRWAAGESSWDSGILDGDVVVHGTTEAWNRMLMATLYPGRPTNLAQEILAQIGESEAS